MPIGGDGLASLSLTSAVVILVLWGALWALRRLRGVAPWTARDCAVLRSLALGPRERLLVVRVGTRHLVVGVGAAAVSLLCELDEPLPPPSADDPRFKAALSQAMKTWRRG
ncbi:MAG TPA: flagellar biosynthetic protein FliO [Stellaceae bacterium]|nr:flagellar biosynthetic protein FliO [Stellaceae bacterium]